MYLRKCPASTDIDRGCDRLIGVDMNESMVRIEHENWLPIPGYEDYEVSDLGRIRSLKFGGSRILRLQPAKHGGYPCFGPSVGGRKYLLKAHVVVMLAFVGPRPDGMEVCHEDGDPMNARLSNLRYAPHSENELDKLRHGTHTNANKTHCPRGHEYNEANTRVSAVPTGFCRFCRACERVQYAKHAEDNARKARERRALKKISATQVGWLP